MRKPRRRTHRSRTRRRVKRSSTKKDRKKKKKTRQEQLRDEGNSAAGASGQGDGSGRQRVDSVGDLLLQELEATGDDHLIDSPRVSGTEAIVAARLAASAAANALRHSPGITNRKTVRKGKHTNINAAISDDDDDSNDAR